MRKPLAASNKMMRNYLAELLNEEASDDRKQLLAEKTAEDKKVERLLQGVAPNLDIEDLNSTITSAKSQAKHAVSNVPVTAFDVQTQKIKTKREALVEAPFQALFFDVAGLIVAVPLIELGGIHTLDKVTPLLGKPAWFKGVMLHREDKINIVDTSSWVMPDKNDQKLNDSLNYQYVIMLNDSDWGLMAEKLVDTVTLNTDDIKWLEPTAKRPWLAGLVKNKMCALLDVEALIQLLSEGADIHSSI